MSNKLPKVPQQQHSMQHVQLRHEKTEVTFSPLPPAHELELLEKINPGITERILLMAEKEQDERHYQKREILELENKNQRALNFNTRLGLFLSFGSVLVSTGMCVYFAYLGGIAAAGDTAKVVIVSLAGVFIVGRWIAAKQSQPKA